MGIPEERQPAARGPRPPLYLLPVLIMIVGVGAAILWWGVVLPSLEDTEWLRTRSRLRATLRTLPLVLLAVGVLMAVRLSLRDLYRGALRHRDRTAAGPAIVVGYRQASVEALSRLGVEDGGAFGFRYRLVEPLSDGSLRLLRVDRRGRETASGAGQTGELQFGQGVVMLRSGARPRLLVELRSPFGEETVEVRVLDRTVSTFPCRVTAGDDVESQPRESPPRRDRRSPDRPSR